MPFGYHDHEEIQRLLEDAGFRDIRIDVVSKMSMPTRAENAATGLVQGSPVSVVIAERDASLFPKIKSAVADALATSFGGSTFQAPMRAIVIEARK